ncbi:EI24 domain-containing protein [Kamptonema sp. UHCC 0994]|uniref:EI24 domain-containing protein n=1 Tax=Kamptonema sp. UHCC 0994 TaxID=3031329 RepID=UPI0023B928AE|nr:EI24 domain-containing protein [Kamptonema sp. UHCC 0994]MDF0552837.1 EI24 domain-containing protein [Kamptonema sp. UHCC 0994]
MAPQQGSNTANPLIRAPLGILAGASYPFRAFVLLLHTPKLWGYVLVPVLVNLIIGTALYLGLLFPSLEGIDVLVADLSTKFNTMIAGLPAWLSYLSVLTSVLGWLLRTLLVAGLLLIIGFLLVQFGVILGAPWYGQLSEQLELVRIGNLPPADTSLLGIFGEIKRAVGFELRKLQLLFSVGLPLLLLNFVPGIGSIVATIGGIALGATLVCLDFLSAPLDRRRLNFRDKLAVVKASLPASATFGLVCFGLVSIPLLNLLAIPLCLVAGTLFFCDRIWPSRFADVEKITDSKLSNSPTE